MTKIIALIITLFLFTLSTDLYAQAEIEPKQTDEPESSLITDTPKEGFQVAIQLARKGVTSTQPDGDVLFMPQEWKVKVIKLEENEE